MIYLLFIPATIATILLYGFLHTSIEKEETHEIDSTVAKRIKDKYGI
jgi:hypothetical protein